MKTIFVTGIERSGSTIVARILKACGAYTGETTEMCENRGLKHAVDNYYKHVLYLPEFGQKPLPNTLDVVLLPNWDSTVTKILQKDGWDGVQTWLYKSCRIAQIWPLWNYFYPDAKYIIVRRRTGDVVQSCMKTGYMKACATSEEWLEWIHVQEQYFLEMYELGLNCKEVWPERMAVGDFAQMKTVVEWTGLQWNPCVEDMVKVLLRNSKQK